MAFSFSSWFKGKEPSDNEAAPGETTHPEAPASPLTTPPGVTPGGRVHTAQPAPRPGPRMATPSGAPPANLRDPSQRPPVPLGTRPPQVSAVAPKVSPSALPARKISFAGPGSPSAAMPPVPAVAARPAVADVPPPMDVPESVVRLKVGDFIERVPAGLLAPGDHPRDQEVEFLSTELYSDLSKGRASIPASVIYAKCPSLFARPVSETEDAEVQLPLHRIVEQMGAALQTRQDQESETPSAEIETPFLHVANEDNARLPKANGTTVGALPSAMVRPGPRRTGQISTISPLKAPAELSPPLVPPTPAGVGSMNQTKRPPSTVRASVAGGKIRLNDGTVAPRPSVAMPNGTAAPAAGEQENGAASPAPAIPLPAASSPSHQVFKKTARIQIPPISLRGAGAAGAPGPRPLSAFAPPSAPAAQQPPSFRPVPSGEPATPNFRPAPPAGEPGAPTFRTSPPPPSTKRVPSSFAPGARPSFPPPAFPAVPPAGQGPAAPAATTPPPAAPVNDDRKINLSLAAILKGLPFSALGVSASSLGDDARIDLPFGLIEGQLGQGRVSVPRNVFVEALPEARRDVLGANFDLPEISIPLQEVFQNLPSNALAIRADQIVEETAHIYPTPFSQKAEEDAIRLGMVEPIKPASPTPEPVAAEPEPAAEPASEMAAPPEEAVAEPIAEESTQEEVSAAAPENFVDTEEASAFEAKSELAEETPAESTGETLDLLSDDALHEASTPEQEGALFAEPVTLDEVETAHAEETAAPTEAPTTSGENSQEESATAQGSQAFPELPAVPAAEAVPSSQALAPAAVELPEPDLEINAPAVPAAVAFEPAFGTDEISAAAPPVAPAQTAAVPATAKPAPVHAEDSVLQALFMSEDDMDAKTIVRHVCQLPGVIGCAVMFGDGLPLAGNFPEGKTKAGFTAMAPTHFKRTASFTKDVSLGELEAMTIHTSEGMLSFFMHGDICVSVRHAGRGFLPGVREKLVIVTRELANTYSTEPVAGGSSSARH